MRKQPSKLLAVGFPDFWQGVHDKYRVVFEESERLVTLQNKLFRKRVSEPLHIVLRLLARSASNSFGALITLVLNGYGNDAMRIARSIFETDVVAGYLKRHPEEIGDYLDYHVILQKRLYDYMREYTPELLERINRGLILEMKSRHAGVGPRLRRRRKGWTEKSLESMAADVGLTESYKTFYSWASSLHHADIVGLSFQVDRSTLDIEPAPSEQWLEVALNVGHESLLRVLSSYVEAADLGMDEEMDRAIRRLKKAWNSQQARPVSQPSSPELTY